LVSTFLQQGKISNETLKEAINRVQRGLIDAEAAVFKKAAKELLSLSDEQIRELLDNGALAEV
jgi:hypothetical protein